MKIINIPKPKIYNLIEYLALYKTNVRKSQKRYAMYDNWIHIEEVILGSKIVEVTENLNKRYFELPTTPRKNVMDGMQILVQIKI